MKSRHKILDEIMFYIFERAQCKDNTDKYLEHVLDYCKKDYQQALKRKIKMIKKENESND